MATYLLIGGNSGIGLATAESLKEQGDDLIAASRSKENLQNLGIEVQDFDAESPGELELPDSLDGLAYFPGTINLKPATRLTPEDLMTDLQINAIGALQVIQQALPALKKSGQGSIVLYSSVAVQTGMPFHASVAAAKGAIEGLTRSLAAELAPTLRVNAIAPSLTDTPLASRFLTDENKRKAAEERHPLNRIASAAEIGRLTAFLLSQQSAPLTGQILHPDNGLSALRLLK
ncbi:MAG: SDR family oxidoreductase [Verrucomicrobiota bacterium JB023]|nr:SDR family oxidoreductase [Verrucomicrobiota bacterium JB023]